MTVSNIAASFELPDYLKAKPSPSLLKREAEKKFKYSRLITVAQSRLKKRSALNAQLLLLLSSLTSVTYLQTPLNFKNGSLQRLPRNVSVKGPELMDVAVRI